MLAFRIALARLRALFRRDSTTDEIREELDFHVAMRADQYAREGLDAAAARQAALRRFGNVAVIQDRGYDVRGGGVMETILQDVKYSLRQLGHQPSFTILAGLTLALGIGVSTALFSVIDAALLRPLPYPHPEQLVTIDVEETSQTGTTSRFAPSMVDIRTWRTLPAILAQAGMGRVSSGFTPLIVDTGTPDRMIVGEASEGFLETYGIFPILGRGIHADDTRDGAPAVALLGHAYWQSAFGGDPRVLGRDIRIQDRPVTIVGVLPAGFYKETALWRARQFNGAMIDRRGTGTPVIARLREGVSLAQAKAALEAVTTAASLVGPTPHPVRVVIDSMYEDETRQFGATINTLSMAVGLILIIACVNVAGLLLARGATRHVELAIRAAIGAGRGRLVRQLLTESLLLALAGAAAGVLLAYVALDSLVALVPLVAARQFAGGDQRHRARLRARPHGGDGAALRTGAGPQALARTEDDQHDAGRRRTRRRAAVETRRAVSHRHRGGAGAGADDRRRTDPSQLRQARVGGSRLQRRERPDRRSRAARPERRGEA